MLQDLLKALEGILKPGNAIYNQSTTPESAVWSDPVDRFGCIANPQMTLCLEAGYYKAIKECIVLCISFSRAFYWLYIYELLRWGEVHKNYHLQNRDSACVGWGNIPSRWEASTAELDKRMKQKCVVGVTEPIVGPSLDTSLGCKFMFPMFWKLITTCLITSLLHQEDDVCQQNITVCAPG